jgi:E3 ubiquitin-protein ligase HUWE1
MYESTCNIYEAYFKNFLLCQFQSDIRTLSITHWGSELGLSVLNGLAELYTSLVWESTLLLALCSDDIISPGCKFGREDMEKLFPSEMRVSKRLFSLQSG